MHNEILSVRLAFPPSVNSYWRRKGKQHFISDAGRAFKVAAWCDLKMAWRRPPIEERVEVNVEFCRGDRRAFDVDNYAKAVLDALQGVVIVNDQQVDSLTLRRLRPDPDGPGFCVVTIGVL